MEIEFPLKKVLEKRLKIRAEWIGDNGTPCKLNANLNGVYADKIIKILEVYLIERVPYWTRKSIFNDTVD